MTLRDLPDIKHLCELIQEGPKTMAELMEASDLDEESILVVLSHLEGLGLIGRFEVADGGLAN